MHELLNVKCATGLDSYCTADTTDAWRSRCSRRCSMSPCSLCYTDSGMLGGWWFGASSSSPDSNFLRVANAFPNRRLSDNTLMTPKIRIAPSCASSPGGTPGGGLPIRRHSSIGPQERRGSTINLSPPTVSLTLFHCSSHSCVWIPCTCTL